MVEVRKPLALGLAQNLRLQMSTELAGTLRLVCYINPLSCQCLGAEKEAVYWGCSPSCLVLISVN